MKPGLQPQPGNSGALASRFDGREYWLGRMGVIVMVHRKYNMSAFGWLAAEKVNSVHRP